MNELEKSYEIAAKLKKIKEIMRHNFTQQFNEIKITGPQMMIIGMLLHHHEMKVSDLSEKMGYSNSTVSGILDRLEKNDSIVRIRSIEDRRVVMVKLTEKFRKEAETRFKCLDDYMVGIISKASEEEKDKILIGLEVLEKVMMNKEENKDVNKDVNKNENKDVNKDEHKEKE